MPGSCWWVDGRGRCGHRRRRFRGELRHPASCPHWATSSRRDATCGSRPAPRWRCSSSKGWSWSAGGRHGLPMHSRSTPPRTGSARRSRCSRSRTTIAAPSMGSWTTPRSEHCSSSRSTRASSRPAISTAAPQPRSASRRRRATEAAPLARGSIAAPAGGADPGRPPSPGPGHFPGRPPRCPPHLCRGRYRSVVRALRLRRQCVAV